MSSSGAPDPRHLHAGLDKLGPVRRDATVRKLQERPELPDLVAADRYLELKRPRSLLGGGRSGAGTQREPSRRWPAASDLRTWLWRRTHAHDCNSNPARIIPRLWPWHRSAHCRFAPRSRPSRRRRKPLALAGTAKIHAGMAEHVAGQSLAEIRDPHPCRR